MDQHREELSLSLQERQALAEMWSNLAAEDPRLASCLHGERWTRRVPISIAGVLVVLGMILIVSSPPTALVSKTIGVASYAAGMVAGVQLRAGRPRSGTARTR